MSIKRVFLSWLLPGLIALCASPAWAKFAPGDCEALLLEIRAVSQEMGYSGWQLEQPLVGGFQPLPQSVHLDPDLSDIGYFLWWLRQMDDVLASPTEHYATLAHNYLKAIAGRGETSSDEAVKGILRNSPLWTASPDALQIAVLLYETSQNPLDVLSLQKRLPLRDRPAFRKRVEDTILRRWRASEFTDKFAFENEDVYLRLFSVTPMEWIPAPVREFAEHNWIFLDKYPALKMPSEAIKPLPAGMHYAGHCVEMTRGHVGTLDLPSCFPGGAAIIRKALNHHAKGDTVFVQVRGELVGALKFSGDESMIALRNVTDEHGRLVLVMGGVYQVAETIRSAIEHGDGVKKLPGGYSAIALDHLSVKSISFMFNRGAWAEPEMMPALARIAELPSVMGERGHVHLDVWPKFLKALDTRREELRALLNQKAH